MSLMTVRGLMTQGLAHDARHGESAFRVYILLATERVQINYNPDEIRPPTGTEIWQRWQFVRTGNARVPCWIVRVPKEIIWGHGGLWSDNSVAMLAAIFRIHFPLTAEGQIAPPPPRLAPKTPDLEGLKQDRLH
jgi:hypothetical protein